MNIFVLGDSPMESAEMHCDKHVCKMLIEYAQMLSTAHRVLDGDEVISESLYKVAHKNHPCTIWTRTNRSNYLWLFSLWKNLAIEYSMRYPPKFHASWVKLNGYLQFSPRNIPEGKLSEQPQCMPDYCKDEEDVVEAYRNYYINEKSDFATWKFYGAPNWFNEGVKNAHIRL